MKCPVCDDAETIESGPYSLDRGLFWYGGSAVSLTWTESEIMYLLIRAYPHPARMAVLFETLNTNDSPKARNKLRVTLYHIRKRINTLGVDIVNVFSEGYRLSQEVRKKRSKRIDWSKEMTNVQQMRGKGKTWKQIGNHYNVTGNTARLSYARHMPDM